MKNEFIQFLENLRIKNKSDISLKYKSITKILNKYFYDSNSDINNSLQVGSIGRKTAINGVSDLDMVFELPHVIFKKYDKYETNGQSQLLQEIKNLILKTYPKSKIRGDGQVVVIDFKKQKIELLPGFIQGNKSYIYPDSSGGGTWKNTNPRPEMDEIANFNTISNGNLKILAKMIRGWKNNTGIKINGLLIDTLCYNFLKSKKKYLKDQDSEFQYMLRDFFQYISNLDANQKSWLAPGSNQKVYKKDNFQKKAKKANKLLYEAISENKYNNYRKVFGHLFPKKEFQKSICDSVSFSQKTRNTEEFIEDYFPVDIQYSLSINCLVRQDGYRPQYLRDIKYLKPNKNLTFSIENCDVPPPYEIKWKVKNEGDEAVRRDCIRGQIVNGSSNGEKYEPTKFKGDHYVECYIIKNDVCVARSNIEVPIMINREIDI